MPPALGNVTFRNPNSHVPVAQQPQQLPAMERQSVERLGERQFLNHLQFLKYHPQKCLLYQKG